MIEIQHKVHGSLADAEKALVMPLMQIGQMLARRIVARAIRGQGPQGPWSELGAHSKSTPGRYFWVSPGEPQPSGFVLRPEAGKWAGWAAYESAKDYLKRIGKRRRTFRRSGRLLQSLTLRARSPQHVRLSFRGSRKGANGKRVRNNTVAYKASKHERSALLMPSTSEVAEAGNLAAEVVSQQLVEQQGQATRAFNFRRRRASFRRRSSRLLDSLGV